MPDLETLLREVKPEPDHQWATKLDAKVAAGFPTPPSRLKRARRTISEHFFAFGAVGAVASVLILFVVVIGSSVEMGGDDGETAGGSSSASSSVAVPEAKTEEIAPQASPNATEDSAGATGGSLEPQRRAATPGADRAVLKNASITLSAKPNEVEGVADRAIRIVDGLGGYVETSEVTRGSNSASAALTLKLPTADLDKGLAQISKLAHVSSRSQQAQDVTDQREQLESLVRDARADREGLRSRLAKATTDKERSRLRALLNRATRRVTARTRDLNQLGAEVSYATVDLSIEGDRRSGAIADPDDRWTPGDALSDAGRVLEVVAGVLLIAAAVLLPVAVLIVLAMLGGRVLRHRRRERALGPA
jgi:hypothetical protein